MNPVPHYEFAVSESSFYRCMPNYSASSVDIIINRFNTLNEICDGYYIIEENNILLANG